eukprot:gnl/Carplike_NY0171/3431_a4630_275.p1 GENE.gnl/Carplike_NY0171/3431_a4630_275~~gnl/Carplike_NY0171/3431_a4630_275.p1  ORF type:complete len:247 (-),score=85.30 gnl/Carplike_NY0171/3431_a4630_275:71-742(-)
MIKKRESVEPIQNPKPFSLIFVPFTRVMSSASSSDSCSSLCISSVCARIRRVLKQLSSGIGRVTWGERATVSHITDAHSSSSSSIDASKFRCEGGTDETFAFLATFVERCPIIVVGSDDDIVKLCGFIDANVDGCVVETVIRVASFNHLLSVPFKKQRFVTDIGTTQNTYGVCIVVRGKGNTILSLQDELVDGVHDCTVSYVSGEDVDSVLSSLQSVLLQQKL